MSADPVVSVVMSVHNGERYLSSALASVLGQREVALELIVVDDGSTDTTSRILADVAARDDRVHAVAQANGGLTKALIRGCTMARGRYIARQDADDLSAQGRLAEQARMLDQDQGLAFVSSWAEVIGPNDEPLLLHTRPADTDDAMDLLVRRRCGPPGHGSVMMRKEAYFRVGGYRPKFYYAQDSDLWLRLAMVGGLRYAQRVLYRYRVSADSISGQLHEHKLPYARLVTQLHRARRNGEEDQPLLEAAELPDPSDRAAVKDSSAATNYFIGRCLFARRDPRARRYLRASIKANPRNWRGLALGAAAEVLAPFWRPQAASWD